MALSDSLVKQAVDALRSKVCECGEPKVENQSFCRRCYFALPGKLRQELYKSVSDGYAEVWSEAKDYLHQQTDRCNQTGLF